jgi:hypothetical protein
MLPYSLVGPKDSDSHIESKEPNDEREPPARYLRKPGMWRLIANGSGAEPRCFRVGAGTQCGHIIAAAYALGARAAGLNSLRRLPFSYALARRCARWNTR